MRNSGTAGDLALLDRINPSHAFAGAGALYIPARIPGQLTDMQRVVQNTGAVANGVP
jgi:hypothetical protein